MARSLKLCGTNLKLYDNVQGGPRFVAIVAQVMWQTAQQRRNLTLGAGHPLRGLGTPALLARVWGCARAVVDGDGGPRLQGREIAAVHEALVAGWRRLRAWPAGRGAPLPVGEGGWGEVRARAGASGRWPRYGVLGEG